MLFGNHYSQSNPDPTALDASKRSKLVRARARVRARGRVRGLWLGALEGQHELGACGRDTRRLR